MQVILLDDVANIGHEGNVVSVADGYARNYLIPQKMAVPATKGSIKQLADRRHAITGREDQKRAAAEELVERLKQGTLIIRASVGEGGRLHGEVTPQNIADAIAEQHSVEVRRRDIDLPMPIREKGDYLGTTTLYKDVKTELPLRVIGLDEPAEQAEDTEAGEPAGSPADADENAD